MTAQSSIEGVVPPKPSEKKIKGYPFRSVMYLPKFHKYYIDLTDEEHEILNHRKQALEKIKDVFNQINN